MQFTFKMNKGECWWGGTVDHGTKMPFTEKSTYEADFRLVAPNQTMPLYLSNQGRYIWSENPFSVNIQDGEFIIEGEGVEIYSAGNCLRDAYRAAMKRHFPFSGKKLPHEFFKTAQYNTWIEYLYNPTQEGVLKYASDIINSGFEPGIFIIDEGWHGRYGIWEFDFLRFPNPKEMVDKLHKMGFIVMLWVTPLVSPDGEHFIKSRRPENNLFLRTVNGETALARWWNGYSAILNFTNEADCKFLDNKLEHLMKDYGVDGFKFDGGTVYMYSQDNIANGKIDCKYSPHEFNIAWNRFGEKYKYHEYKDTYKGGGRSVIQRIRDKSPSWDCEGLNTLIPNSIVAGLLGHPFICPDMIGGGEWATFSKPGFKLDEELFIRMAQCSALFPMMQFSLAPWRVLSQEGLKIVLDAASLHKKMSDEIISLIDESVVSGEPVLRSMEYEYPGLGYEKIVDQYLLGSDILVAPVVTRGTRKREVVFPPGRWQADDGRIFEGNNSAEVDSPLEKLLWFRKVK